MNFDVDRTDFRHTRLVEQATRDLADDELNDGEVEMEVESFAFTANNISYASAGDFLDYWGFFPTDAPWGRIPVMGIGRVTRSANPDIAVGGRYFGFFPMTDRHIVQASPSSEGFVDRAEYRAKHAAAYRAFNLVDDDPAYHPATEGQYLIARGLFITSFLVDDFLGEQAFFGADQVIVTSASSRTSIALAHRLQQRGGMHVVGLTAERNRPFVEQLGLYDEVFTYDRIDSIDATRTSVVVDMAGNVEVLGRVHAHVDPNLAYSCQVGATHWDAGGSPAAMAGPAPKFFFAPTQIKKRSQEWGRERFEREVATALAGFLDHAAGWMRIERSSGPEAVEAVYRSTLDGTGDPAVGHIVSMNNAPLAGQ